MAELYKECHEELGSIYVPKTIAQILVNVSMIDNFSRKALILEFHIQALEEEIRRIADFKCQLPHCIHFLEDAIEILKQEMQRWKRREKCPVVEEFMPLMSGLEGCSSAKESKDINEKKEWMSSVQLWTTPVQYDNSFDTKNQDSLLHNNSSHQGDQASGSGGSFKKKGGPCMPFNIATMDNKGVDPVSSSAAESEVAPIDLNVTGEDPQPQEPHPRPPQKKQRRCWSPELHRLFVDALQQLGGVESATPKQIREVMDVEGLTNDEVKSHLQASHSKAFRGGTGTELLVADTGQPTRWWCTDARGRTLICTWPEDPFQGVRATLVQAWSERRMGNSRVIAGTCALGRIMENVYR